jgi:hypothetical protein
LKKKFFAILWLAGLALAAAKYPPGQHWREISRGSLTIIFPAARFMEAEAALAAADSLHGKLAAFWRAPFLDRTRIVLDDSTDQANGFATFFPFNLVGANLAEPPPDSELAASRNWLDLVLAHELTHVFNLNAGSGLFRALRSLFGNLPLLYSATQLPPWVIEGLAVEEESRLTGDGRLNHAPYRLMLDAARRDDRFPRWSRITGLPTAWPGPTAKYLFGAGFMEFLVEKYGSDRLRKYLELTTNQLVLFGPSRDFKRAFGQTLGSLWEEYRNQPQAVDKTASFGPAPEPLTASGFLNQYPCPLANNALAYYHHDYQKRGAVEMINSQSRQAKTLFKMDAVNSLSFAAKENKIFLSASDYFHAGSDFSDLYEYDMNNGRLQRLSRGQRLSQPVKKENSDEIYCVQRRDGGYHLALFDIKKRTTKALSRLFAGLAQLSISPDGNRIAAAVKPEGGPWGIGLFSTAGEWNKFITAQGADFSQPRWQGNEKILFIMTGTETARLASFSLAGNDSGVCDDPRLRGLRQFAFSSDGREVLFTYFSGRGQELARLDLDGLSFSPLELAVASSIPETKTATPPAASRPYRFWRDLLPQWWSPALRSGGDETQAGIMTSGQDALGIHSFSLEGYYGFSSHRANFIFNYTYDGLFPTLSLSYSDSSEYFSGSHNSWRTQEMKLASLWPLRIRKRSQLYAYADLHMERVSEINVQETYIIPSSYNGFRLGLEFNSARAYYDSISPSDGVRLTLQGSLHPDGMGNKGASRTIQADMRHYISLFRPGVVAWRLAAARSWDTHSNYFNMGGFQAEGGMGNSQPFRLLRGFPTGFQFGDRGWQFNAEYRLPLFGIEKTILPAVSIDRVWLAPFFDIGGLASGNDVYPLAYSLGAEAMLRLAFGGAAAYDLALGVAHGFGPEKQWQIYLRTGRSF